MLRKKTIINFLIGSTLLVLGLTSCQPGEVSRPEEKITAQQFTNDSRSPTGAPQSTELQKAELDPALIESYWEAGPHAHTYVVNDDGMNSSCARCHAPLEFIPSMDEMPESCAACKFEIDDPPPLVAEADWESIPCDICHRVKKDKVDPEYAWLSVPPIDEYIEVESTTELCMNCHIRIDIPGHETPDLVNAHSDFTCTQCHDAHSTTARSCNSEDCHADYTTSFDIIPGHDQPHSNINCWVCHDASGLSVGLDNNENWVTLLDPGELPYASHNIIKETFCERCHYLGNPWKLSEEVSQATP